MCPVVKAQRKANNSKGKIPRDLQKTDVSETYYTAGKIPGISRKELFLVEIDSDRKYK